MFPSSIEHDFRRVESILIDVARNPGVARTYATPAGLKSKTFAAHVRFGARIWLQHLFPSPLFDLQFPTLWPTLAISERLDSIIIGPRGARNSYVAPSSSGNGGVVQVLCNDPTPEDINALLHLHERGIITEATHFPNMQDADAALIETRIETERRNVGFAPHPVTGYIML